MTTTTTKVWTICSCMIKCKLLISHHKLYQVSTQWLTRRDFWKYCNWSSVGCKTCEKLHIKPLEHFFSLRSCIHTYAVHVYTNSICYANAHKPCSLPDLKAQVRKVYLLTLSDFNVLHVWSSIMLYINFYEYSKIKLVCKIFACSRT